MTRYILRPPLKVTRLTLNPDGVELTLKLPWSDGTTLIRMTCERFIDRLLALVPPPRANTLLYGGLFAANARLRPQVVAYQRPGVTPRKRIRPANPGKPRNTSWADLMRHSFGLDVLACPQCGGRMRFVATILDKASIQQILRHEGLDTPKPRAGSSHRETDFHYEVDEHTLADTREDDFSQLDTSDPWGPRDTSPPAQGRTPLRRHPTKPPREPALWRPTRRSCHPQAVGRGFMRTDRQRIAQYTVYVTLSNTPCQSIMPPMGHEQTST